MACLTPITITITHPRTSYLGNFSHITGLIF